MASAFETVFEALFKYRPLVFERGEFVFAAPWPLYVAGLLAAAALLPALVSYARVQGKTRPVDRAVLAGFRAAALALLLFCLFRPTLVVSTAVPQRNFLGILIDDSRSMQIADLDGAPRSAFIARNFGDDGAALHAALADRFQLRYFRFAGDADRLADPAALTYSGERTRLGEALDRARRELAALPLAGLVVLTDGADNSHEAMTEPLLALKAVGVPVYTVGLGRERFDRDVELSRVETPRGVLKGASLVVDLVVTQNGYAGRRVPLHVEDDGRIVSTQEITLPGDGEAATVRVHFEAKEAGPRRFTFRIPAQPGEMVDRNNAQEALIVVHDRREKILYLEGEPRWEVAFLRRAVQEDENLQLVVLQRTAENKFLRLDIDDPEELAAGFPRTREELFRYRGLILGSVEASFFTHDQLQMIADFVDQRGGGLLFLGGRRAFAEGGFDGTPVAEVMPVFLETDAGPGGRPFFDSVFVRPTPAGLGHAALQLAPTVEESARRWETLPALTVVNPIRRVKPGAITLLTGVGGSRDQVILAYHRYGRGTAIAFPVQDSWIWRMHADIPVEDQTHQTLWRQMLRWLVSGVPGQVTVATARDRVSPGEPVVLHAEVEDETYLRINNGQVTATITPPDGVPIELPMDWVVDRDGEYRASFTPDEPGLYEVRVIAERDGKVVAADVAYVHATDLSTEFFGAQMQAPLLKRIAEETGGRFYTPETVGTLPEDISFTERGTTVQESRDLWDMPIIFLLLVGLVAGEWLYRRRRELV